MSDINFEHYKIFYYAAKFKNITTAANYLYLSQPSVSRCIKTLENELECKLFIRSKRGVELTQSGKILYKHVSIACRHIFSAEEEIKLMKDSDSAIIRLGGSAVAMQSFLIERIAYFHKHYPKIQIKIDSMTTPEAIDALKSNIIDVAVVTSPFTDKAALDIKVIRELQDIVIAGNSFSELKDREVPLRELVNYPLICLNDSTTTRHYLDSVFRQHNILLKPDMELASINFVMPMVKDNLGIGFVQGRLVKDEIESGQVFRVKTKESIPPREICAVTCTKYQVAPAVQHFIDNLIEQEQTT